MGYLYHAQRWPVVRFEFRGRLTADDMAAYIADSDALIAGGKPFANVMDGTNMLVPEIEFVRQQARWIRDNAEGMRRLNRGIAFVAPSTVIRGLVRAVMHFQALPVEYAWFANADEAMEWAGTRASDS
jgi:hypothetical protein